MSQAAISLIVLVGAVALFMWNRWSVGVVAIATALALYLTGVISGADAVAGFGDPIIVFIAALFVLSEGLESSGVTTWAGQTLLAKVGTGRSKVLVAIMILAAVMAALITPNGAAAALLPVVVLAARRMGAPTSQLAMPLAFAASAGALLVLSGSPVNVIVSDALKDGTGGSFGFFEFAIVGVPLVIVTVLVAVTLGPRLLPRRSPSSLPSDFSEHLDTLVEHYRLEEGFFRLRVDDGSPVVGREMATLAPPEDVRIIGAQDSAGEPAEPTHTLSVGDVLVVTGPTDGISVLASEHRLSITRTPLTRATRTAMLDRVVGVAEIVIPPRSQHIGETWFPGMVSSGVTVLAIRRLGKDTGLRPVALNEGDALLVHGNWSAVESLSEDDEVLVVDSPELVRRQTVSFGPKAWRAVIILFGTVALLASGAVTPAIAGLIGVVAMVVTGVVTPAQSYRSIPWQTLVLIGGLIPLSVAIRTSGAADLIADAIVNLVGDSSPYLLLIVLFVVTAVLGQVISNTATVLIVVPIAVAAATEAGVSLAPMLMLVAVAGAASFLTPIATPANMMVMGPGGYRFSDYWKLGLVTMLAWMVVTVVLIPIVWPL